MPNIALEGEVCFEIDAQKRLVRARIAGPVTIAQILQAMEAIQSKGGYELDYDGLIDFRNFTGDWSADDVRRIADKVRETAVAPGLRRAILIDDERQNELMKRLQAFTILAPITYRTFRTLEAATEWLQERRPAQT